MRYGSVCSGIEAASVAWEPLGWKPAWFCEIEPFPSAVLAHHYPEVKNHGDFTKLIDAAHPVHDEPPIDILVGGTPCQAFSVAGLRAGLADPRGGLTLEFIKLVRALRPKWVVWENVPGVLSQDGGRAFGAFLGALAESGYGWAYRVLDAQYVRVDGYPGAVPQRRKRVFVVGCAGGDFARAAAVLLEPEGVRRNSPPRRESRQGVAADAGCRPVGIDGYNHEMTGDIASALSTKSDHMRSLVADVAGSLDTECGGGKLTHQSATNGHLIIRPTFWNGSDVAETLTCTSDDQRLPDKNRMQMVVHPVHFDVYNHKTTGDVCGVLREQHGTNMNAVLHPVVLRCLTPVEFSDGAHHGGGLNGQDAYTGRIQPVAFSFDYKQSGNPKATHQFCVEHTAPLIKERTHAVGKQPFAFDTYNYATSDMSQTIKSPSGGANESVGTVMQAMAVRRLTPVECERLQGFPDDYTRIPWKKKPADECPDGGRYKALGNSMAVNCMRWIGRRIELVEKA